MTVEPASTFPPTIVLVHEKERPSKCSVRPLWGKPGFRFHYWPLHPNVPTPDLRGYVRLAVDAPPLTLADAESGLLILDGTWRYAERMEREYADVPARGLPPVVTAYPRVSKLFADPDTGLATIEAIYAAYVILGRDPVGLLDDYPWARAFLDRNRALFGAPSPATLARLGPPSGEE